MVEHELRRALAAANARGWRVADITHGFRKLMPRLQLDLLRNVERGLGAWQVEHGLTDEDVVCIARRLTTLLGRLWPAPPVDAAGAGGIDRKLLAKVRGLLAKAESTDYQAEAEALSAKAHELMARYSIDDARAHATAGPIDVVSRRVLIDDPYAYQRMVLLTEVADACGCRVLCMPNIGLATVFGMVVDVEATEVLFTSLLLQVSQAMLTSGESPRGAPASTVAAFRRAFFVGFAERVGDRLRDLRQRVVADMSADSGHDVLPVLVNREAAVDAAIAAFGGKTWRRRRVSDYAGLMAGDHAGANASLNLPPLSSSRESLSA